MFRQSYPEDGQQPDLNDDFRGVDSCNHGIDGHYEEKYRKGFHSMPAEHLIHIQTQKYEGNK